MQARYVGIPPIPRLVIGLVLAVFMFAVFLSGTNLSGPTLLPLGLLGLGQAGGAVADLLAEQRPRLARIVWWMSFGITLFSLYDAWHIALLR